MTIQDWGVTYEELEPHYDRFEYLCGTSGTAGNLQGPDPARRQSVRGTALAPLSESRAAAALQSHPVRRRRRRKLGYKPFPQPSGQHVAGLCESARRALGPCTYCGFCEWFGCGNYSKASPQTTILPVLVRKSNFLIRDECEVTRINTDASGKRATGVTFVDSSGKEWEQPAELVILSAYTIFNVQLLLLSGIGAPYDPVANKGVDRAQFHASDDFRCRELLRQIEVHLQSLHRLGRDRHVHR